MRPCWYREDGVGSRYQPMTKPPVSSFSFWWPTLIQHLTDADMNTFPFSLISRQLCTNDGAKRSSNTEYEQSSRIHFAQDLDGNYSSLQDNANSFSITYRNSLNPIVLSFECVHGASIYKWKKFTQLSIHFLRKKNYFRLNEPANLIENCTSVRYGLHEEESARYTHAQFNSHSAAAASTCFPEL